MTGNLINKISKMLKVKYTFSLLMLFFIINSCYKDESNDDNDIINQIELPVAKTDSVSNIFITTAICGGNITSNGGDVIRARGVCYGINPNPTIDNLKTSDGLGTGSFVSYLTNLLPNTTYYIRAYATNQKGTAYGNEFQFITQDIARPVTDIDGNTYPSIVIDTKVWMAKDLRVTHYPNGDPIPNVTDDEDWKNLYEKDDAYCFYNNDSNSDYGALYTYAAATGDNWERDNSNVNGEGGQGVCPDGWHLPTDSEWNALRYYMTNNSTSSYPGGELKETGLIHWNYPNIGATNSIGFTAIPGGMRKESDGTFKGLGDFVVWWSATDYVSTMSYYWSTAYDHANLEHQFDLKSNAFSVRCVRD